MLRPAPPSNTAADHLQILREASPRCRRFRRKLISPATAAPATPDQELHKLAPAPLPVIYSVRCELRRREKPR